MLYSNGQVPAIPGIPIYLDGFYCTGSTQVEGCGQAYSTLKGMQNHCRKVHSWQSSKGKGGSSRSKSQADPNQMWTAAPTQELFKVAHWRRSIAVHPHIAARQAGTSRQAEALSRLGQEFMQEVEQQRAERAAARVVAVSHSRVEVNSWLAHTEWDRHLEGFRVEKLRAVVQPIVQAENEIEIDQESEAGLGRVCQQVGHAIQQAFQICRSNQVPRDLLLFINRRETREANNKKPLYTNYQTSTLRKYCTVIAKLLRYIWRSQSWEKKPGYRLTPAQSKALQDLQQLSQLPSGRQGRRQRQERAQKIQEGIVRWYLSMVGHVLRGNEWESGLLSGLAVLGLDTELGIWCEPQNYTPHLLAVVTTTRVCVIYLAWLSNIQEMEQLTEQGYSPQEAEDEAQSVGEHVEEFARRFLTLRQFGGKATPMDRIMHMRTYGRKIQMNTKAGARVTWSNQARTVHIDKTRFEMDELRGLIHGLVSSCRVLLAKAMFLSGEEQLPEVPIHKLRDH